MQISNLQNSIEAVLFASGEPLKLKKLAEIIEIDEATCEKLIADLAEQYKVRSGLRIVKLSNFYQMITAPEVSETVRKFSEVRSNSPLSPAAFEVLAIIAYHQPITKNYIEQIRGVDCYGIVSSLVEKGLIREAGRLDLPGKPILYETTEIFLRSFALSGIAELNLPLKS